MSRREFTLEAEIAQMCASRDQLDKLIQEKRAEQLQSLHARVGLPDIDSLAKALWEYVTPAVRAELSNGLDPGNGQRSVTSARRRRYDDTFRAQVRYALEQRQSPAQVRKAFGLSAATLVNWMKSWGIDGPRKRAANGAAPNGQSLQESATV